MEPMLVTVKAHSEKASQRTKNRAGHAMASTMWLDKISHPDCMGGKNVGCSKALADSMVQSKAASK